VFHHGALMLCVRVHVQQESRGVSTERRSAKAAASRKTAVRQRLTFGVGPSWGSK
jgi:hypothetical protein